MNMIFKNLTLQQIMSEFIPSFGFSLVIAEYFYKFGSFSVECIAFLMSWYLIGRSIQTIKSIIKKK